MTSSTVPTHLLLILVTKKYPNRHVLSVTLNNPDWSCQFGSRWDREQKVWNKCQVLRISRRSNIVVALDLEPGMVIPSIPLPIPSQFTEEELRKHHSPKVEVGAISKTHPIIEGSCHNGVFAEPQDSNGLEASSPLISSRGRQKPWHQQCSNILPAMFV